MYNVYNMHFFGETIIYIILYTYLFGYNDNKIVNTYIALMYFKYNIIYNHFYRFIEKLIILTYIYIYIFTVNIYNINLI